MGRMKELYIEIREKYGDELPQDFSLGQYQLKKELEYAELCEIEEAIKKVKSSGSTNAENALGDS